MRVLQGGDCYYSDADEDGNGDEQGNGGEEDQDNGLGTYEVQAVQVARRRNSCDVETPLFVPWERPAYALVDRSKILLATGQYADAI